MRNFYLFLMAVFLFGCGNNKGIISLQQVESIDRQSLVILKDDPTRESVLPVLTKWFADNGYSNTVIESLSEAKPENYVFTYRANWSWDMATYMRKVQMRVLQQGETLGSLNFDAVNYGGIGKFGSAADRLVILLDVLFGKISEEEANILLNDS